MISSKGKILIGVSVCLLLSFFGFYYALEAMLPFMWVMLITACVLQVIWFYIDFKYIKDFFTMKTTQQGLNMGALILIMFTLLVSLNFLVVKKNKTYDFSSESQHTLSPLSKKILDNLKSPLVFKFFYKNGAENVEANRKTFSQFIKFYTENSSLVSVEFLEMNNNPSDVKKFEASKPSGELFVEYENEKTRVEAQFLGAQGQKYNEQEVSNAIIKVTRKEKKIVYFVGGHGERDVQQEKLETGVSSFKELLNKNSYEVNELNLALVNEIPEQTKALIIMAPKVAYSEKELNMVMQYLEKGGALLLCLDDKIDAGLAKVLNLGGLKLNDFYVFNILNTNVGQIVNSNQPTVAVDFSPASPITKVFNPNMTLLFGKPNSLGETSPGEYVKTEYLVRTPQASVALKNLDSEKYEGEPKTFNLAAQTVGQMKKDGAIFRMVSVADADVFSNVHIFQNANRDFALNSVAYLVQDHDLISIAPKEVGITRLKLNPVETQNYFKLMIVGYILPLPFLLLLIGILIWAKKRNA